MFKRIKESGSGSSPVANDVSLGSVPSSEKNEKFGAKFCRHTAGRVASVAKVPIYALGALLNGAMMIIKVPVSPLATGLQKLGFGSKSGLFVNWNFKAVQRDAIMTAHLTNMAWLSAKHAVIAPPQNYKPFMDAVGETASVLVVGRYHSKLTNESETNFGLAPLWTEMPVEDVWKVTFGDQSKNTEGTPKGLLRSPSRTIEIAPGVLQKTH